MSNIQEEQIRELQNQVLKLETALVTLITWMAQAANSPINVAEAQTIIMMIKK